MTAVATVVARDELLRLLVTIVLHCAETEAADRARLLFRFGERIHAYDGYLDDSTVLQQPALFQLLRDCGFDLLGEIVIVYEAII